MKKMLALLLACAMVLGLCACGGSSAPADSGSAQSPSASADAIPDEMTSDNGKYEVAFVTNIDALKDKSFNQGTFDGVKLYAAANGKSYKYYQPANISNATDDDRVDAFVLACENGAQVVVASGFLQMAALKIVAPQYPDVHFIFIDGSPVTDEAGNALENVASIDFKEEESGFLAGYAAVMEGYTKLGFTGGGGGDTPSCVRYGYGFVQGADAAAKAKGVQVEMNYSWLYGSSFAASSELQTMATGWYSNGTEAIFCCGGSMFSSVAAAAGAEDGKVIGVDVDQSYESASVITSAVKGLVDATSWALEQHYEGKWDTIGGVSTSLGAKENAVGLPTDTWSLQNWSVEDYEALLADIASGKLAISSEQVPEPAGTANVTVNVIK